MATAQRGTRTRTVEETVVVLTLTEDEADALEALVLGESGAVMERIYWALRQTEPPAPAADTFEYNGVVYDLGAQYRDQDGDVWSFTGRLSGDGIPRATCIGNASSVATIAMIADSCGPLTKVTP
ncbi:phiSA1p31-related protein [Streptomyces californicus]|uniref:phiSA1p31-related protein n=1 Tax=Streptomyces californicus TaxID=67351 RepID=UPI0004C1F33C|nr:phiSA1p31-related protein [Streptomyces californicus]QRV53472.1 phiSA1p31-related protein [Streptomyces californicus]